MTLIPGRHNILIEADSVTSHSFANIVYERGWRAVFRRNRHTRPAGSSVASAKSEESESLPHIK